MRVVLFTSGGPLALAALGTLRERAEVVGVVVPAERWGWSPRALVRGIVRTRSRARLLSLARWEVVRYRTGDESDLETDLRRRAPDLYVVASFPRLLWPSLLSVPRLGAVGLHASRLPQHRGPAPLFWTYVHDDAEAGITLFWLDAGEDTGAIAAVDSEPLPRGIPIDDLYPALAKKAGALLGAMLDPIAAGTAPRGPQHEGTATREPTPRPGPAHIDYQTWGAERVWHVFSGLGDRHRLLWDENGRRLAHGRATAFRVEPHGHRPGRVEPADGGWRVYCRDGVVDVIKKRWWSRWSEALRPRS